MTRLNRAQIASYIAAGCASLIGCKGVEESEIKIVARPNEPRNWDAEIPSLPRSGPAMAEAKEMIAWLREVPTGGLWGQRARSGDIKPADCKETPCRAVRCVGDDVARE